MDNDNNINEKIVTTLMLLKYYIIIIIIAVVVVVVDRRAYAVAGDLNVYCCTYIIDPSATIGL